ncbi:glycosyltransferase [Candidatus Micrarchaeota archaeon]|nr:glycosyltransferase [Candidatus Micrarchaeota archaeon]
MRHLQQYAVFTGKEEIQKIREQGATLNDAHVAHLSSTFYGGGVAQLLSTMVPLLNEAGVRTGWRILRGYPEFFTITKKIHNGLYGDHDIRLTLSEKRTYLRVNELNTKYMHLGGHDLIIVHDPQPLPLIRFKKELAAPDSVNNQKWLWRYHLDFRKHNPHVWKYLKPFASKYDGIIVTLPEYQTDVRKPHHFEAPAIDPLNDKNRPLTKKQARRILEGHGVPLDKPLITQVSRFDPWKDPLGVIDAFKQVKKYKDCRLLMLGDMAADDPQGKFVYDQVIKKAAGDPDIHAVNIENDLLVNAAQKMSDVVVQKSLAEGFGLTVAEALWKETPVVASRVGGIPMQVEHGKGGLLVDSIAECAESIRYLLEHPKEAERMGKEGREHIRKNFLITRLVLNEISIIQSTLGKKSAP